MNKQEILDFIKAQTFVTLASINEGGFPESRMLVNLQNPAIAPHLTEYFAAHDHVLYLMTNTHSEKIAQLAKNPKASLYYADTGDFRGMLLTGEITKVSSGEIKRALWHKSWEVYYSGGLEGGDFSVLCFTPERYKFYSDLSVKKGPVIW